MAYGHDFRRKILTLYIRSCVLLSCSECPPPRGQSSKSTEWSSWSRSCRKNSRIFAEMVWAIPIWTASMVRNTGLKSQQVIPLVSRRGPWIPPDCLWRRNFSLTWRRLASAEDQHQPGAQPYTWSRKLMGATARVETTERLTRGQSLTDMGSRGYRTSPLSSMVRLSSLR